MGGVDPFGDQIAVRKCQLSAARVSARLECFDFTLRTCPHLPLSPTSNISDTFFMRSSPSVGSLLCSSLGVDPVTCVLTPLISVTIIHRRHCHPLLLILNQVCGSKDEPDPGGEGRGEGDPGSNTGNGSIFDQSIILSHFCYSRSLRNPFKPQVYRY